MWECLTKFEASNGKVYWASIPRGTSPKLDSEVDSYTDIASLERGDKATKTSIKKILAPLPSSGLPMICIGINYAEHAKEAKLTVPKDPVMWYKPPTALANPDEDIPIAQVIFPNFLDYEVSSNNCPLLV
jgi:2-keto-4-pentenoate hydratase/2-oxohepta-3-ene-1,7-dioic acid hydratase in catechol pathway